MPPPFVYIVSSNQDYLSLFGASFVIKNIKILLGTITGNARSVAEQISNSCSEQNYNMTLVKKASLEDLQTDAETLVLICTSTTGAGGLPWGLTPLYLALKENTLLNLSSLQYGVIGLGDSLFQSTFCGGAEKIDQLLEQYGAQKIGDSLMIDTPVTKSYQTLASQWLLGNLCKGGNCDS